MTFCTLNQRRVSVTHRYPAIGLCLFVLIGSLFAAPSARAVEINKLEPSQMIFAKSGQSFIDQVFEDKMVFVGRGVHSVKFVGCEFRDSTLKILGATDVKVVLSTWRGSHSTDQSAIHVAGATNLLIDGCTLTDVQRGLLIISNSNGDNTNLTLRRTVIRRWAQIHTDPNRHEAILVHGYGAGEAYTVRNLVIEDVWVTEWPGVPLCIWECSLDGLTVRRFESDSPRPIRFGIARSRSTQTIKNVVFESNDETDSRYATRQMIAQPRLDMVVGPGSHPENWESIELPKAIRVRLHYVWGNNNKFLPGEFDSVETARQSLAEDPKTVKTIAAVAEQEDRPINAMELQMGHAVTPGSYD